MMTSPSIKSFAPRMTPERSRLTEIVLLAVVIILFSWFVLKPKVIALAQLRQERSALEDQRTAVADQKAELFSLLSELESASADVAVLDEALPLQSRITTVAVLVDTMAKANGMSVASLALDGSETGESTAAADKQTLSDPYKAERTIHTATVLVTTSGTLEQFIGFLNAIESSTRILDVQTIDITGEQEGQLLFRVKVRGYSYSS